MSGEDTIRAAAARLTASGDSRPRAARDPVNLPMIRNWLEAIDPWSHERNARRGRLRFEIGKRRVWKSQDALSFHAERGRNIPD